MDNDRGRQLRPAELQKLQNKAFALFEYKHDDKNYGVMEDWRSHADLLAEGKIFVDDCDGYAFTICETLLHMDGIKPEDVLFIICETETGEGHAVAGYTSGGTTWILENRYTEIYDWKKRSGYKWNYYMQFNNPGQWHQIDK